MIVVIISVMMCFIVQSGVTRCPSDVNRQLMTLSPAQQAKGALQQV